jgi:hypothetical protein
MSASTLSDRPETVTPTTTDADVETAFRDIVGLDKKVEDADSAGDSAWLNHYFTEADIIRSSTTGVTVTALCGKRFNLGGKSKTSTRDPQKHPMCTACVDAYNQLSDD